MTGSSEERKAIWRRSTSGKYAAVVEAFGERARTWRGSGADDLEASLGDIPDSSLAADWRYLCEQMVRDLRHGPGRTLAILDEVRRSILVDRRRENVRDRIERERRAARRLGIQRLAAGHCRIAPVKKADYRTVVTKDRSAEGP